MSLGLAMTLTTALVIAGIWAYRALPDYQLRCLGRRIGLELNSHTLPSQRIERVREVLTADFVSTCYSIRSLAFCASGDHFSKGIYDELARLASEDISLESVERLLNILGSLPQEIDTSTQGTRLILIRDSLTELQQLEQCLTAPTPATT